MKFQDHLLEEQVAVVQQENLPLKLEVVVDNHQDLLLSVLALVEQLVQIMELTILVAVEVLLAQELLVLVDQV